jgi:osmotically inducible protein OsmC
MPVRTAEARWEGDLRSGKGHVKLGSGAYEGAYSFATRFGDEPGSNPEELIGAAHASCFSMALAAGLSRDGHPPRSIETNATVHLDKDDAGFKISRIELKTVGDVPGIDAATFVKAAEDAKKGCPVSRALAGVDISLDASFKG